MELAVLASRPVVGSSRNKREGDVMSSIPMLHLFFSPPETPRKNMVPIWQKTKLYQVLSAWNDTFLLSQSKYWYSAQPYCCCFGNSFCVTEAHVTMTQFIHTLSLKWVQHSSEGWSAYLCICAIFQAKLLDDGVDPHLFVSWGILFGWQAKIGRECEVLSYGQSTHQNVTLEGERKETMNDNNKKRFLGTKSHRMISEGSRDWKNDCLGEHDNVLSKTF